MTIKKIFWNGDDLVEKLENVAEKIVGIVITALLIYAFALS